MERRTKIREFVRVRYVPPNNSDVKVAVGASVRDIIHVGVKASCINPCDTRFLAKTIEQLRLFLCIIFLLCLNNETCLLDRSCFHSHLQLAIG
jgi:hypothetical protein